MQLKYLRLFITVPIILLTTCLTSVGQISGQTSCTVNTNYTYSYYSSSYLPYPNWQPSGGTVMNSWSSVGGSGGTYYASIKWTSTGTRSLVFANYSQTLSTLSGIYVCSSGQDAGVTLAGATSICTSSSYNYTATPENGGPSPHYVWKVNGTTKQSGSNASYLASQLALNDVVSVTMTSDIVCLSPRTVTASKTITNATSPVPVTAQINNHTGVICPNIPPNAFVVSVTNGGSPTYVWYKGTTPVTDNLVSGNVYQPPANALQEDDMIKCKVTSTLSCISGPAAVWSDAIEISVTPPPSTPTAIGPANVTTTSFVARWEVEPGATKYGLAVSSDNNFSNLVYQNGDLTGTSKSITNLTAGETYYYRIYAKNCGGNSGVSYTITTTTTPPAPAILNPASITSNSFRAKWSAANGATNYLLDVATSSNFSSGIVYNGLTVSATYKDVNNLSAGTMYYYRVRARKWSQTSAYSVNESALLLPPSPQGLNTVSVTANSFTADWDSAPSATSYRLDVSTNSSFSSFVSGYTNLTVLGTSKSVTGLTPGTTYYYRVRAVNATGASANSVTMSKLLYPPEPEALGPVSVTANSFTADWNSATSATSYRLDVSTSSSFSSFVSGYNNLTVTGTSKSVTGLTPGTTYHYRVRAVNATGTSLNSSPISKLLLPEAPQVLSPVSVTTNSFTADWNGVTSATSYRLDVSTSSSFANFVSGYYNLTVSSGTSRSVTGLSPGTTYYYRVRAVNATGPSANSEPISKLLYPEAPTANIITSVSATSLVANWTISNGATGYRLDVSTNSSFSSFVSGYNNLSVTGGALNKNVTGLTPNTTYYYRVRAENATGVSVSSDVVSRLLPTLAPTATDATNIGPSSFVANWIAVTGAVSYRLFVSTNSSFSSYVQGYNNLSVTGTNKQVTGLDPATTYYYRLQALNTSSTSAYSNNISVPVTQDYNYIRTISVTVKNLTTLSQLESANKDQCITQYSFFDGLGRPIQNVTKEGSPLGHDVVQPVVYDAFGREAVKYLPFVADEISGWYKEAVINTATGEYQNAAAGFYSTSGSGVATGLPYAKTVFEPSPLNRVIKQGAPGSSWQPDATNDYSATDHTVKFAYESNDATEVLKWNYIPSPSYPFGLVNAATSGSPNKYAANQLFKNKTKDENQNEVITFKDKLGRVILKKVQGPDNTWAETYYIYDDFGNLATVIPPAAVAKLATEYHNELDADRDDFLELWAFRYQYDERGRMIMKQSPGAGPVYMVYDNRDRLVMTQDGNQRNATPVKEWTFTKYDVLNRPVLTGKYNNNDDREAMQTAVDSYYSNLTSGQAWFETYEGSTGDVLGYSNSSFPAVSAESNYYTATYYDLYDSYIAPTGYTYQNESLPGQESTSFARLSGLATASLMKNLSSSTFLRTVNYYDDRYRIIQSIADHHKGTVRTSNVYDFSGKLTISKRTYVVNSVTKTVKETYKYDHAGRVLNVKHSTDGATDVMIVKNEYNEIGQLIDKKLHSTDGGNTFMQSVDHRYNIRGWLTKINEADVTNAASGDPGFDYFGMELAYDNSVSGLSTTPMYNGNISAIHWSKGNGGSVGKQAYTFTYDPMNRLEEASHFDYLGLAWESFEKSYQEKIHEYDLNGNIKKLSRRTFGGALMDSLSYGYTGNRLDFVHDYGNQSEGFINTNTGADDYDYDHNGNMDQDKNKGLLNKGNIKYNYLNLPSEVIKGTESIKYIYDASGRKLAQEVYSNNGGTLVKYTDYIGELVYEGGNLQFLLHPEGRVLPDGSGWEYQYHLKDHLGNVRVTFTTKPQAPVTYPANMETGTANSGESEFGNYNSTSFDLVDHTDPAGTTYQRVQWLNGGASGRVGLTKSLSVMPGDRVSVTAQAKYMNLSGTGNMTPFAAALTAAFGVSSGSTGEQLKLYNSLNDYGLSVAGGEHPDDSETAPKAFVTILLFDRNFNLLDAAWDQITTDGEQVSPTTKEPPHDELSKEVTVQEAGFAYIFLSNEHPTYVDVYFDDVEVGHALSPIVSSADYFPFGLTFNSYSRENSVPNMYQYNGKEKQDELDLGWLDYMTRQYDPSLGRFLSIDLAADLMRRMSPYTYAFNNPLRFTDPDGMIPKDETITVGSIDTKKAHMDVITETTRENEVVSTEMITNAAGGKTRKETTQYTTTTVSTMLEYDEDGNVVNETQTSSIQTWTTTVHTDIGEDGKPTGGFIEKTGDVIFENVNMEHSGKGSSLVQDAKDYRAAHGKSINTQNRNAANVAKAENWMRGVATADGAFGMLSKLINMTPAGVAIGGAFLGITTVAMSSDLERIRSKNDNCDNCIKRY